MSRHSKSPNIFFLWAKLTVSLVPFWGTRTFQITFHSVLCAAEKTKKFNSGMFFFLLGFVASFTIQIKQNYNCIDWIIMDAAIPIMCTFFFQEKKVFLLGKWVLYFVLHVFYLIYIYLIIFNCCLLINLVPLCDQTMPLLDRFYNTLQYITVLL